MKRQAADPPSESPTRQSNAAELAVPAARSHPVDKGWRIILGCLVLVAATILTYQPVWHAGYIWDDDVYVTENKLLAAPDGLRRIWFSQESPSQYFPLTYTTFRADYALWGLNPS